MSGHGWLHSADTIHGRIRAATWWDTLSGRLIELHQPRYAPHQQPHCTECNRDGVPGWPCATYREITRYVTRTEDVDSLLRQMREGSDDTQPNIFRRRRFDRRRS